MVRQAEAIRRLEASSSTPVSTIVPFQKDYASDARLCLTVVCFVSREVGSRIWDQALQLSRCDERHYIYPPRSMHLTLQNIRIIHDPPNFDTSTLERAAGVLASCLRDVPAHKAVLRGLLELPTSLGVPVYFDDTMADTIFGLRGALAAAGLKDDKRYVDDGVVFGNVTFCRYTAPPNEALKRRIAERKSIELGELWIDHAALITTNAVCHPGKTEIIQRMELKR